MALREAGLNQVVIGATGLTLEARQDESLLVRDIVVTRSTGGQVLAVVGQRTVGIWRTTGIGGNHLATPVGGAGKARGDGRTLLGMLYDMELWRGIPIPAGYTFSLSGVAGAQAVQAITYDRYDPGDIVRDRPNGPEASELDYLSYGRQAASVQAAGDSRYTVARSGQAFPTFPWIGSAPANADTTIYGVLGSTFAPTANTGTAGSATEYLRFTDQRRVLGDRNRHGYVFWESPGNQTANQIGNGTSKIGNFSDVDGRLPMLWEPPLMYQGGEELIVELESQAVGAGQAMTVDATEIALIMRVVRR